MNIQKVRTDNLRHYIEASQMKVADFARKHDIEPSYISQLLNGHRGFGEKAARNMEAKTGMPAMSLDREDELSGEPPAPIANPDDYAMIPKYDVRPSCGPGAHVDDFLEVKGTLAFQKKWIASLGLTGANLGLGTASGNSMSPTLEDGQTLLFNFDDILPKNTRIYVISLDGEVMIKRLINAVSHWIIRSDNPDKTTYPDIQVSPEILRDLKIHARVVWRGGEL